MAPPSLWPNNQARILGFPRSPSTAHVTIWWNQSSRDQSTSSRRSSSLRLLYYRLNQSPTVKKRRIMKRSLCAIGLAWRQQTQRPRALVWSTRVQRSVFPRAATDCVQLGFSKLSSLNFTSHKSRATECVDRYCLEWGFMGDDVEISQCFVYGSRHGFCRMCIISL